MLNIALLSFEYPPETGFGGIGTYTWYQARAMAKLGHQVHVLAGATTPTQIRSNEHEGVTVHRFKAEGRILQLVQVFDRFRLWWTKNRIENAVSMNRGFKRLCETYQFDVIEMPECGGEGAFLNQFSAEKRIIKFHSPAALIMDFYDVRKADTIGCSFIEKLGIRSADAFTSCSRFLADEVVRKLKVKKPLRVIPNGIDLELFDASEQINAREKFGISKDRLMIFFAGRMESRKGIHLCKDIAASILQRYNVTMVFAGQDLFNFMKDDMLPYLNSLNLKGSVQFVGKLDLADVRSCLCQTDIFLIPSTWENCPYSCLEAMAAGRAIVASDAGGLPELIRDNETGILAGSGEPEGFIRGLECLIADKSLREKLGAAARRAVEKSYTDVHIAKMTTDYYRECRRNGT